MAKKSKSEQFESELQDVEAAVETEAAELKVEFDEWWSGVMDKIPAVHHKEIIKADFRGRGIPGMATLEAFDKALEMYGLRLK